MFNLEEDKNLVQSLPHTEEDNEFSQLLSHLYWGSLKKYSDVKVQLPLNILDNSKWTNARRDNSDVRVSDLERLYYNCDYHAAIKLSSDILKADPYHPTCLPLHVALLVELNRTSDLFKLSHSLVDLFPEWCVA